MGHQQLCCSHPRKFGQDSSSCLVCSNQHGLIQKYGLNMCCQCFCQYMKATGFKRESLCTVGRNVFQYSTMENKHGSSSKK
uniref:Small ribosomal subunit protein uS14 n=1 Tax=Lynx canadensis TaxID=61383 RepID=A0A667GAQ9_LYNCA